jgi:hypothetical protein
MERVIGASMACASVLTAYALRHFLGSIDLSQWSMSKQTHLISKALVLSINLVDEPQALAQWVYPLLPAPKLRDAANQLDHLGYFRPPLLRSNQIREIADPAAPGSSEYGEIQQGLKNDEGLAMVGWAYLPASHRPAEAVLLTYDDAQGNPTIIAIAIPPLWEQYAPTKKRPEASTPRWTKIIKRDQLPEGAGVLKAWAFDAEHGRAYRLLGQARL